MIVVRDHLADAVTEANVLRHGSCRREENLRRRGMRIFVEEVMLHFPGMVVAQTVGQHDLLQRLMEQTMLVALVPGFRQLQFVEHSEFHGSLSPFSGVLARTQTSAGRLFRFSMGECNRQSGARRILPAPGHACRCVILGSVASSRSVKAARHSSMVVVTAAGGAQFQFPLGGLAAERASIRFENAAELLVRMQANVDRTRQLDGTAHHLLRLVERALATCAARKTPP